MMINRRIFCCFLSLCTIFAPSWAGSTDDDCKQVNKTSAYRLKKFLNCNYIWNGLYASNNATNVTIIIFPLSAVMRDYYSVLELDTYMHIAWKDARQVWNPKDFDGLEVIYVDSMNIWTPDIAVQSAGSDTKNERDIIKDRCQVRFNGQVLCTPRHHHAIKCRPDFSLWPYHRHNCTFVISSWMRSAVQLEIEPPTKKRKTVIMYEFVNNADWDLTVSRAAYEKKKSEHSTSVSVPKLSIDFIVDRNLTQLRTRYVLQGIIMMLLTLTTVWLEPLSKERLGVASLNPIIHLLCINDVKLFLPYGDDKIPKILYFYMNSFVLTFVACILTLFLRKFQETRIPLPEWISRLVSSILRYRIGRFILLNVLDPQRSFEVDSEERNDLVGSSSRPTVWTPVINFLSWMSLLTFLFIYIFMWATLVPRISMRKTVVGIDWGQ